MRSSSADRGDITIQGKETCVVIGAFRILPLVAKQIGAFRVLQNVTQVKVITIVKSVSNTISLVIISALKTMHIRPSQYIHTALLIYPLGPGKIFIRPCHTDQLAYLIKVLRTGCFCIDPGIDSRAAVLALSPTGQYC